MKKYGFILIVALSLLVVASGTPSNTSAEPIKLKWSTFQSNANPMSKQILIPWAKMLEERTNGNVEVVFYWGGSLSKGPDAYDATIAGVTDITHGPTAYNPGRFTLHEVVSLPGLGFPDATSATDTLMKLCKKFPQILDQYKQVKVLFIFMDVPVQVHATKPVRTMEDLKGMKIRAPGSQTPHWKALGCVPVSMPGGEVYMALQKGIIEGDAHTMVPFFDYKLMEVTKYTTICSLYNTTFYEVMNLDTWNKLPSSIQKEIDKISNEWGAQFAAAAMDKAEKENIEKAKAIKGHEMIYLSESERARWNKRCQEIVWPEWIKEQEDKGLPGKELLDEAVKLAAEYK